MGQNKTKGDREPTPKNDAKVADIITGSKSLAEGKSYEHGYPDLMEHHINRGSGGRKEKRGGAD